MRVEWSQGSPYRYAWEGGGLRFVGQDRPAPVNYGLVEGLLNPADGEEVDAVYLGPPLSWPKAPRAWTLRRPPASSPGSPRNAGPPSWGLRRPGPG